MSDERASKEQGEWPRDVLLCPECGVLGWGHRTNCKSVNDPKETVAIVPASSIQGLLEALAKIAHEPWTLPHAREIASDALSNYKAVSNGG